MKRTKNRSGQTFGWISVLVLLLGCSDSKRSVAPAPVAKNPSASFERVVENLQHYLDQLQIQPLAVIEDGAFSEFQVSREVISHELTPPADPGGEYRGSITVATRWSVSYRPPAAKPAEQPDKQQDSELPEADQTAQDTISDGIQVLDSEVIANLPPSVKRLPSAFTPNSIGKHESDEEQRTFQFVFRNERWELVPEPEATENEEATSESSSNYKSLDIEVMRALRLQ